MRLVAGDDGAAVAGAGRVDEHHIGEVEPGVGIRRQDRRRGRARCVAAHGDDPRADGAGLQPARRHAGAAVEDEGHRPRRVVRAVQRVGDEGDVRERLAPLVGGADGARGAGEGQRAARQRSRL